MPLAHAQRREMRLAVDIAEEQRLGIVGQVGQAYPDQPPLTIQLGLESVELQQPRTPVTECRRQRLRAIAFPVGAIEHAAGEPDFQEHQRPAWA